MTLRLSEKPRTCQWIRHTYDRRSQYCQLNEVREACPIACGECCEDISGYSFYVEGISTSCDMLSDVGASDYCEKWSNGRMIRNGCPKSCDFCPATISNAPSVVESDEPSSKPSEKP